MDIRDYIRLALSEDVGDGDHTSLSTIPPDAQKRARLLVKENGIVAGVEVGDRAGVTPEALLNAVVVVVGYILGTALDTNSAKG